MTRNARLDGDNAGLDGDNARLDRDRMEEFWQEWLAANRQVERSRDWRPLADFYTPDATYGWMYTPDEHFMAVGREEIRDYALGTEMYGLDGWHYDYVATLMDERAGMIVGFWRQRAGVTDDSTGEEYEITGIGGSWFGLTWHEDAAPAGLRFCWQRDWFDLGAAGHTFLTLIQDGKATPELQERVALDGMSQPGHYRYADLPSTVWPPPVAQGRHVTQEESA